MLLLILGLTILLGIILSISMDDWEMMGVASFFAGIEILAIAMILGGVINGRAIEDKIKMYQEENSVIETQVETAVKQYMTFEKETFVELKTKDSYITFVTMYPELKTNTLVGKQIEVYLENNNKIKELKESKIEVSNLKWWLYFGR